MKNFRIFHLKTFMFLVVKFSVHLNRLVLVMPVSFWHRLNVAIGKALDASKRIIIVGDLNEDQLNVQNYHVKDILTINNLVNTIEVPTRVTTTSAILLDLIIVPDSEKNT